MKRLLASGALFVLLATAVPPAAGVAGFGDVDDDRYHTDAVQWMVDQEVTTGTSPSCFSPDGLVTRGQIAAFLWRMAGEPPAGEPHPFVDVVADWQQDAVSWMFAERITVGTSPDRYSPSDLITRGEVAALLHRLAGAPEAEAHPFGDVVRIWQTTPVAWMFSEGITTGTSSSTFSPDFRVSRAQVATFLYRYSGQPDVVVDSAEPTCDGGDLVRIVTETAYDRFVTVGAVTLRLPSARIELIGFHESGNDGARQLEVLPTDVAITTMETRHRGTGSRSAADVVVDPTEEIRAPVTGTVIRGGGYTLYCDHRDEFVVIEPVGQPGWEVKVLHFEGLQVTAGDEVVAGETVIGTNAAILPFVSQIDELTAALAWPHVHIEVVDPSIPDRPSGSC